MRGREAFRDAKSTHRPGPVPLLRARSVRAEARFNESTKLFSPDGRKSNEGYVGASQPLLCMRPASHEHFEGPRRGAAPAPMFTTARAAACAHSHAARTLTDRQLCAFPFTVMQVSTWRADVVLYASSVHVLTPIGIGTTLGAGHLAVQQLLSTMLG